MASPESAPSFPPGYFQEWSGDSCIKIAIAFIILEIFAVSMRFYAKVAIKTSLSMDDYLIIPALLSCLGLCAVAIICMAGVKIAGVGHHAGAIHTDKTKAVLVWERCFFALDWLYAGGIAFPKLSVLIFYLRLFPIRGFRIAVYVLIFFVSGLSIGIMVAALFKCSHVPSALNKSIAGGHCIDAQAYFRWTSPPNVIADIAMLILPLPIVWNLNTSTGQKIGLTMIFTVGSFGIISACIRMSKFFMQEAFVDTPWVAVALVNWTVVEPGSYLIAACLPFLRPLFTRIVPRVKGTLGIITRKTTNSRNWPSSDIERGAKFRRLHIEGQGLTQSKMTISGGASDHNGQRWRDSKANKIPLNKISVAHEISVVSAPYTG